MDLVGSSVWTEYKKLIQEDAHDTFMQDDLLWKRAQPSIDENAEDNLAQTFVDVTLKVLFQYNVFRTWPVNTTTETGELDDQSITVLMSIKYLRDNGYLNANDNFDYNVDEDRFFIKGVEYKGTGDTEVSQAQDEPLIIMLILSREETATTDDNN